MTRDPVLAGSAGTRRTHFGMRAFRLPGPGDRDAVFPPLQEFHRVERKPFQRWPVATAERPISYPWSLRDRKSTRLNSSHVSISYAVFCLKKKKKKITYLKAIITHQPLPVTRSHAQLLLNRRQRAFPDSRLDVAHELYQVDGVSAEPQTLL